MAKKNEFKAKIAIEGEKKYTNAIKEISRSMNVLKSEMKLATSEFDKNDKSVASLTKRNEVLSKMIENQKNIVSQNAKALAETNEKYEKGDPKIQKWQKSLNSAQAELNRMTREFDGNKKAIEDSGKSIEQSGKSFNIFGRNAGDASKKVFDFGKMVKANLTSEAIKSGFNAIGNAVKGIAKSLVSATKSAGEYADKFIKMSDKTGISAKTLQGFSAISKRIGVDLEFFTNALVKNTRSMDSAIKNGGKTKSVYEKIGVSVKDASGIMRSSEAVFWDVTDALKNMQNITERDAIALQIFGKSAQNLNPIINRGSEEIKGMMLNAEAMGKVLGGEQLNSLQTITKAMNAWDGTINTVKMTLISALAPALNDVAVQLNKTAASFSKVVAAIVNDGDVKSAFEEFSNNVRDLADKIKEHLPRFLEVGGMLAKALAKGFWEAIKPILLQVTGFGLLIASAVAGWSALIALAIANWPVTLLLALSGVFAIFLPKIVSWTEKLTDKIDIMLENFTENVKKWVKNLWEKVSTWFSNLDWKGIGRSVVVGIWNGISNSFNWLVDKIRGFANGVTDKIKSFFGIASPSKLFRDKIGKNLALGIGEGFVDEMKIVSREMIDAVKFPHFFSNDSLINSVNSINSDLSLNRNLDSNLNTGLPNYAYLNSDDRLILALQNALSGMSFSVDGDKIGELVINSVERVVYE
jgi:hypothetical protein